MVRLTLPKIEITTFEKGKKKNEVHLWLRRGSLQTACMMGQLETGQPHPPEGGPHWDEDTGSDCWSTCNFLRNLRPQDSGSPAS